ncbi:hypothetical protein Q4603_19310 [Zobellia galactanivorans]|uniref:hypothetical protein n=1 Tax=Zobellia galactanivorans (strain DSM 12802 / CCUG 47099 / CIP 106680 / NCIMB 13871 / Dsij) TaxID=63186 RepID=UPI0026E31E36|nr:hypothetical protein [Zobellia galactanivorans]MDO6810779.1 hypothetical protein [Zobellia galactanivorans]
MKTFIHVLFAFVMCSNAWPQSKIEIGLMGTDQMSLLYQENWFTKKYNRFSPEMDLTKKVAFLFAFALVAAPTFANAPNIDMVEEKEASDCHTYACQVAEQETSVGGDIDEIYEMAYEHCVG